MASVFLVAGRFRSVANPMHRFCPPPKTKQRSIITVITFFRSRETDCTLFVSHRTHTELLWTSSLICLDCHIMMRNPYERFGESEEESVDSSLPPSMAPMRYQVYPLPLTGVRSLIGGTVSLDGESVNLPPGDASVANTSVHYNTEDPEANVDADADSDVDAHASNVQVAASATADEEEEGILELESIEGPPSVVDLSSKESSSIGNYLQPMTFKIIGTKNDHNRPTLPSNGRQPVSQSHKPASILKNPLPTVVHSPPKTPPKRVLALTPSTDNSFFSSTGGWNSPIKEITFFRKKDNEAAGGAANRKAKSAGPDGTSENGSLTSRVDCICSCCPYWLQRSPFWLRAFLLISVLLLVLAAALIVLSIMLVKNNDSNDNDSSPGSSSFPLDGIVPGSSSTAGGGDSGNDRGVVDPVPTPTQSTPNENGNQAPNPSPTTVTSSLFPTPAPVTSMPTSLPSQSPTPIPSTFAPTNTLDTTVVSFFVTAGTWETGLDPDLVLPRLPVREERAFLVHLGDWNEGNDDCSADRYQQVSELWSQSSCAVYFVVGSAETNNCPEPSTALDLWRSSLAGYHDLFWNSPPWIFWDDDSRGFRDAWVFHTNRIAVAGLHLTRGSDTVVEGRAASLVTLDWIEENYQFYRRYARMIILLANAPIEDPAHEDFFTTLFQRMDNRYRNMRWVWVQPASYVNATSGDVVQSSTDQWQPNYNGLPNLDVISVNPNVWPPLRINITEEDAILLDQEDWFNDHTGLSV
jgi:hypothetical protein